MFPAIHDWSGYDALHVDFSVTGAPLPLVLSVRDGRRVDPPLERFDMYDVYAKGRHDVAIDLKRIARGSASTAPVDTSRVESFHIFVDDPQGRPRALRLHRVWLE
jgi:hypothetical protein